MKTITIPKRFGYPSLTITINGKEQTFASGTEISVEDSVAEAIENAIALEPKTGRYLSKIAQIAEGNITEITASDLEGITKICTNAFYTCRSVVKVTIPNSVKSIDVHAFYGCVMLKTLNIGNGVTNIANNAFDWCSSMEGVYLPEIPPTLANVNAFDNIKVDCVFYCKTPESLEAYKKASKWSTLTGTYSFVVDEKNG